jgi:hypothetical protein
MGIPKKEFGNKGKIRPEYSMKGQTQESFGVGFHGGGSIDAPKRKKFDTHFNPKG